MFFIGPAVIFTLDKIVSLQTKYMELDVQDTELLPSGKSIKYKPFT
jgi:dual oxidase